MRPLGAAAATRDGHAHFGTPKRHARRFGLQALTTLNGLRQGLTSAAARILGASRVQLFRALGGIGQDQHLVAGDLQEATTDGHVFFGVAALDADLARLERGEQRRVARQDAQHALRAWSDDHVDGVIGEDLAFGGDDLDPKWHALRIAKE